MRRDMKKLAGACTLVAAIVAVLLLVFNSNRSSHDRRASTVAPTSAPKQLYATAEASARDAIQAANEMDRFQAEVLPLAEDFLMRIETLESLGVIVPIRLPIVTNTVTKMRFAGGPSNSVCTFNIGGHTHFACHIVKRDGKEIKGVNSFVRSGRDEAGAPRNFVQLTGDLIANDEHLKLLADTNHYPARELQDVAIVAQRTLAVLCPEHTGMYPMTESWQEERAAHLLPFYLFAFTRKGRGTDPSNLMRDEILIGFKSTPEGLAFDFFEDNTVTFVEQKSRSRRQ
jgi:hypothetical protein